MDAKDMRKKNDTELAKFLDETRRRLHELSFKAAAQQLKDVRDIRTAKRDIARVLTVQRERTQS